MEIVLTPAAERWIRRMLRMSGVATAVFRLRVKPGGCSGLAVEFDVEAAPTAGDTMWQSSAGTICLDAASEKLLDGATVDFVDSLAQSGFVIKTPEPVAACCSAAPQLVSIGVPAAHQ